jgi:hypothetical protein
MPDLFALPKDKTCVLLRPLITKQTIRGLQNRLGRIRDERPCNSDTDLDEVDVSPHRHPAAAGVRSERRPWCLSREITVRKSPDRPYLVRCLSQGAACVVRPRALRCCSNSRTSCLSASASPLPSGMAPWNHVATKVSVRLARSPKLSARSLFTMASSKQYCTLQARPSDPHRWAVEGDRCWQAWIMVLEACPHQSRPRAAG